jgi:Histidine kinase/Histidine kinase-, DNA gyrase B-, and HSP90-like ATPase
MSPSPFPSNQPWAEHWRRFSAAALRAFHAYAGWLVSITWRRFVVLAALLLVTMGILHDLPPFTWTVTERIENQGPRAVVIPMPSAPPAPAAKPARPAAPAVPAVPNVPTETGPSTNGKPGIEIKIDKQGIRVITPTEEVLSQQAQAQAQADQALETARRTAAAAASAAERGVRIELPAGADTVREVRQAAEEAKRQIEESLKGAREDAEQAMRDAEQARKEAQEALQELVRISQEPQRPSSTTRITRMGIGDFLMQFTVLWVLGSALLKATYKGRIQAEVKAAQATETAEAESLKRQVIEARMAAMQAQVEPHFLFNTLASIDHLIETDPPRASRMQKNLIALLRASMPTMREASGTSTGNSHAGVRDLGRELEVIRPYLEILKMRMEERLTTDISVPDGLLSAEFPPMMIQTLVENAIKHGLEPKAEGGHLRVAAEIVHGKLQMTVADTGLGFGKAATAGTGVGLANIRERLQLLFGQRATLTVAENQPCGTRVTVTVPYTTVAGAGT